MTRRLSDFANGTLKPISRANHYDRPRKPFFRPGGRSPVTGCEQSMHNGTHERLCHVEPESS